LISIGEKARREGYCGQRHSGEAAIKGNPRIKISDFDI
jgi:hypothetical protein